MDEFTKAKVKKIMDDYIKDKIPKHLQNQIKMNYKIRGNNVTIIEERPAFRSEQWVQHDIAQLRKDQEVWKVYWKDSKNKWQYVEEIEPNKNFEKQLEIIEQDNTGVFWG
ncbi:DUF3024 domain-containing protein [Paenibacillus profundus]|uniref:DUF3024 domain-containing protein n=1 Tax=Paenibacillus profundus TaxID=1173085 RepID=A0ABS8YLB8_9BACL|nr:DUF3024 domain-containing protein [Paenibacillus profundus]MCE5172655.1 DUF3024 domain-containing protein [Paenibacillus profundus]